MNSVHDACLPRALTFFVACLAASCGASKETCRTVPTAGTMQPRARRLRSGFPAARIVVGCCTGADICRPLAIDSDCGANHACCTDTGRPRPFRRDTGASPSPPRGRWVRRAPALKACYADRDCDDAAACVTGICGRALRRLRGLRMILTDDDHATAGQERDASRSRSES